MRGVTRSWVWFIVLLFLSSSVWVAPGGAAGEEREPTVDWSMKQSFDPGPGWPEGWTEPAPPNALTLEAQERFEEFQRLVSPKPERAELRVLSPMPEWTREYPYIWQFEPVLCGTTVYFYYYPRPDTKLIGNLWRRQFSLMGTATGKCRFTPLSQIKEVFGNTPEVEEQRRLEFRSVGEMMQAQMGLGYSCIGYAFTGTLENIPVCFNAAYASHRFDVPAYLDPEIGRVRLPVRFVSEIMGATVHWDEPTLTVTIRFPAVSKELVRPVMNPGYSQADLWQPESFSQDRKTFKFGVQTITLEPKTIILTVGKRTATVDGGSVEIDAPPVLKQGRLMVPVRFVAQAMGAKVYWVGAKPIWPTHEGGLAGSRQVHIYTPLWPYFDNPNWYLEQYGVKF